ncbi:RagB/SusD family nutrient uptake outer membrane protein [Niabella beijingensis]|uniref:RagB/SusD family nutrient uptake outer membrane protein n=1 Tax=Niabella beijingensis TaxID=2872700 RepID=UPI001CBF98E7|nr:RagB/SusD family nutrient uptake outer membrane protein [Niabella beijingensis]MBZ4191038.1 RagB/SusD family nutrient uptake outer membrane protein [Niabella beijingensis]
MRKNYFKYSVFCFSLAVLLVALGCNKKLDTQSSSAQSSEVMWKSYDDARNGLVAIYGLSRAALAENNAHWMYGDLRKGDFVATSSGNYLDAIIKNELNKGFPQIKQLTNWRRFYAAVDACNTFIENAESCKQDLRYSDLNCTVDVAQAHMLRSFLYFYMVRIWGDVPLITAASKNGETNQVARTPQDQVMDFCINELRLYRDSLPTEYGGDDKSKLNYDGSYYGQSWSSWGNAFWGYYQCLGLLAHMYAWKGDYQSCLAVTTEINSNPAAARTGYVSSSNARAYLAGRNSIFYSNGVKGSLCYQIISFPYNMANRESGPSGVGHLESLTLASPYVVRAKPDIYVPRDTIARWFYYNGDFRHPYQPEFSNYEDIYFTNYYGTIPIFAKFKNIATGSNTFSIFGSAIPIFRFEDNRLLMAEAQLMLGQFADAYKTLNSVREIRNTPGYWEDTNSQTRPGYKLKPTEASMEGGLLYNIFRERRIELAGEGGWWYDQVRYNRIARNNPAFNKLIDEGGIYWPIDEEIISKNPLIEQNSYWKR